MVCATAVWCMLPERSVSRPIGPISTRAITRRSLDHERAAYPNGMAVTRDDPDALWSPGKG